MSPVSTEAYSSLTYLKLSDTSKTFIHLHVLKPTNLLNQIVSSTYSYVENSFAAVILSIWSLTTLVSKFIFKLFYIPGLSAERVTRPSQDPCISPMML